MARELREMVGVIPANLTEKFVGNNIYVGSGHISLGWEKPDVTIRVFLDEDGRPTATMSSKKAAIELVKPFSTEEERAAFSMEAKAAAYGSMN